MKPALLIQVALVAAAAMGAPTAAPQIRNGASDAAKPATCTVSGVVVKMQGSVPLPSSTVCLREIRGIDPGRYRLRVITQEYGQRKPNDPGSILTLRPSQDLKCRTMNSM